MSLITVSKFNIGQPTALQTNLRREAARFWNDMVRLHKFIRKRRWKWPFAGDFSSLLSKYKKGSRRHRKLRIAKAKMLFINDNQQRNFLHHASKQMIAYCVKQQAGTLVVGDCISLGKNACKKKKGSGTSEYRW